MKPGTVAVLVHPDGTEEIVKNSLPTEDGIQLTVNGGATVKIVDKMCIRDRGDPTGYSLPVETRSGRGKTRGIHIFRRRII